MVASRHRRRRGWRTTTVVVVQVTGGSGRGRLQDAAVHVVDVLDTLRGGGRQRLLLRRAVDNGCFLILLL